MNHKKLKTEILSGKIFIYPTDTLYGIGCNALDKLLVNKIREIKGRDEKPFSIIAPNLSWIHDNFIIDFDITKYLPGPYTLLLKKKFPEFLKWVSSNDRVGIRIPLHPITKDIQESGVPLITTSVNFSGQPSALTLEDIPQEILSKVDFIVPGDVSGKPSTLIIDGREIERK